MGPHPHTKKVNLILDILFSSTIFLLTQNLSGKPFGNAFVSREKHELFGTRKTWVFLAAQRIIKINTDALLILYVGWLQ